MTVSPEGEHTTHITSDVEKHPERGGDSPLKGSYEARQVPADDSRQRALTGELNLYYDAVIAVLRKYDSLLLFGPARPRSNSTKDSSKCSSAPGSWACRPKTK